jgi:hypothetical protein
MRNFFKKRITYIARVLLWLVILLFLLRGLIWLKARISTLQAKANTESAQEAEAEEDFFSGFLGEKIVYSVKLGSITLGRANFHHVCRVQLNGREVNLMTFQTQVARFNDMEKIYSDLRTFLPLKVERDVFIWPNQEKITENYDQENFKLNISKFKGNRKEETLILKEGAIHNAILLPFHVRMMPELEIGWTLVARLPTQEFIIKLISIEDVTVPAGTFKSYRFQSEPRKFEIWVSADERRIPVKIKGSGLLGYTLVMRDYSL